MDDIQKTLIRVGRKDLAQEYFNKVSKVSIKTLYTNEWVELKEIKDPPNGINGYVYSHEKRCDGKTVSILPFRKVDGKTQFLLRNEITPCWRATKPTVSSITGGVENNDPKTTALHELKEEGGYKINGSKLIELGTCFGSKSSDTVHYLYSCDLTDFKKGEETGDGSKIEDKANCFWSKTIDKSEDPLSYIAFRRIKEYL